MANKAVKQQRQVQHNAPLKKQKALFDGSYPAMMNWLIVLVLVVPVAFTATTLDAAVPLRFLLLSVFVLLFILWFFIIRKDHSSFRMSPLLKALLAVGLAYCIWGMVAMFNAINIREAFYETSRAFLNLILFIIVVVAVYNGRSKIVHVCKALTVLALLHSIIGIFQYYQIGFMNIPGNFRPYGLMTNRNLFGSAQALLLPFCIYTFVASNKLWRYITTVSIIGVIASVILSQTRSAWLAVIAILLLSLLLVFIFSPEYRKKWAIATATCVGLIAILVAFFMYIDQEGALSRSLTERITTGRQAAEQADTTMVARNSTTAGMPISPAICK